METGDIFIKTAKGTEEIEKRTYHLDFRHRTALIQVDGHSAVETLLTKIPGDGFALLAELARDGFIAAADGHLISTTPTSTAPAVQQATPKTGFDLDAAKQLAAKSIESLLGPDGEALAVAIEHTKTFTEFVTRAERTRDIIAQMRGAARGKEFWAATGL